MTGTDPSLYHFVKEGVYTVAGMDDQEEMRLTDEGFDILGFANEDKNSVYDFCAGILHMGNLKYVDKKEQGDCDDPARKYTIYFCDRSHPETQNAVPLLYFFMYVCHFW